MDKRLSLYSTLFFTLVAAAGVARPVGAQPGSMFIEPKLATVVGGVSGGVAGGAETVGRM